MKTEFSISTMDLVRIEELRELLRFKTREDVIVFGIDEITRIHFPGLMVVDDDDEEEDMVKNDDNKR